MKKVLIGIAAGFVVLVVGVLLVAAMQPDKFRLERTTTMAAPPEVVFAQVNDFHKWDAWSPWIKLDPNAKNSFEGSTSGEGAIFTWAGNNEVGEGKMTIEKSRPHELVQIRLDFLKPMENTATAEFTFKPEGDKTSVTWAMYGDRPYAGKIMCLFMNMDKMVGSKFEEGLASMKKVSEAEAAKEPETKPEPATIPEKKEAPDEPAGT